MLAPALTTGIAIDVRATASTLGDGSPITSNYQWNFGDTAGEYNTLSGYNASHIYQNAGTYTVTLTITNDLGKTSTVATSVTIAPDTRTKIYVDSVNGSDSNTGLSPSSPLQSAAKATSKITNNTEVLFARGETFVLAGTINLQKSTNVLIDAYGSGSSPVLSTASTASVAISTWYNVYGLTIQNLTFDAQDTATPAMAIQPRGNAETVRNCVFEHVVYGINGNGGPTGFTLMDSTAPTSTSLQGYLFWVQGTDIVVLGNTAVNSVHEHILRTFTADGLLVADNNFTNLDGKGCIEIQDCIYPWVSGNSVTSGDIRVGPLGLWGEPLTDTTQYATIEGNTVHSSEINVYPGTHDASIRNNILLTDGTSAMIDVRGYSSAGFTTSDLRILNNTGITSGSLGQFLDVENHIDGIVLDNNLLVEPNLAIGAYTSAPVYVSEADLSSFTEIKNNVWQTPQVDLALGERRGQLRRRRLCCVRRTDAGRMERLERRRDRLLHDDHADVDLRADGFERGGDGGEQGRRRLRRLLRERPADERLMDGRCGPGLIISPKKLRQQLEAPHRRAGLVFRPASVKLTRCRGESEIRRPNAIKIIAPTPGRRTAIVTIFENTRRGRRPLRGRECGHAIVCGISVRCA